MRNYYFVVPSLPPLSLQDRPEITFQELIARLEASLDRRDLEQTKILRRFIDVCNIRALLMEEEIDPRGNLNKKELDEALLTRSILPDYVFDFLDQFEKIADKIRFFFGLICEFFNQEIPKQKGFLKRYFLFEREWRLVLLALRAKQLGRDVVKELQFEDLNDPFVAQILAQKDADAYEPPQEYAPLKELILAAYSDPWLEQKLFTEYRFKKIGELAEDHPFAIDQILAYMAQLMLVEDRQQLDAARGKMILDTFKTG